MRTKTTTPASLFLLALAYVSVEPTADAAVDSSDTRTGLGAGAVITSGLSDTATGYNSMNKTTSGSDNTATGRGALFKNVTGWTNTATGSGSMYNNLASENTATGASSLGSNTTGTPNTGYHALYSNMTGGGNIAVGDLALYTNQSGFRNTAVGDSASYQGTGNYNTALGSSALYSNTTGSINTAVGAYAMGDASSTASNNTAVGVHALGLVSTGGYNTAAGETALLATTTGTHNTAVGFQALYANTTGSNNTAVGYGAGPIVGGLSNTLALGASAGVSSSNTIQLGDSSIQYIYAQVGLTATSDARFKTKVRENVPGLSFITKLRPITYHWDMKKLKAADDQQYSASDEVKEQKQYTGFLAQEVEVAARQCDFDFSGVTKPANEHEKYGLGYSDFVVPLVRAVQEQQKEIEELRGMVAALKAGGPPPARQRAGLFGDSAGSGALAMGAALVALLYIKRPRRLSAARS